MLAPKKIKYRKRHEGPSPRDGLPRLHAWPSATSGCRRPTAAWVTARQIEAARVALTRHIKRGGRVWIRIFPDKPLTKKPAETRMGKGKGDPEVWVAVVKPGRILFEMEGVTPEVAREAMRLAAHKLAVPTQFCERPGVEHASE